MSTELLRERTTTPPSEPAAALPETAGASPLLQQAQAFADLGREVAENADQGDAAEALLRARRNQSGQ